MDNKKKNTLIYKAYGTNLLPYIHNGENITVEPAEYTELKHKDLILYRSKDGNNIAIFFQKRLELKQIIGKIIRRQIPTAQYLPNSKYLFQFIHKTGCKFLSLIQKAKSYRRLMRCFFKDKITYKIADEKEYDIANIIHCFGQSFLALQKSTLTNIKNYTFIAKRKDKIIGRLSLVYQDKGIFAGWGIFGAYIKPFYRGMGIGEALMHTTFNTLKEKNVKKVYLLVNKNNARAVKLYEKLNFRQIKDIETENVQRNNNKQNTGPRILMKRPIL